MMFNFIKRMKKADKESIRVGLMAGFMKPEVFGIIMMAEQLKRIADNMEGKKNGNS